MPEETNNQLMSLLCFIRTLTDDEFDSLSDEEVINLYIEKINPRQQ